MSKQLIKRLRIFLPEATPEQRELENEAADCIEQQAAEIEALRGFAYSVLHDGGVLLNTLNVYGLIDENGEETPLLTGEASE